MLRSERAGVLHMTPAGRAVLGGSVVLLVVGWALGYPELWIAPAAGIGAVVLAALIALVRKLAPSKGTVSREVYPQKVVRGEVAEARLTATAPAGRSAPAMTVRDRIGGRPIDLQLARLSAGKSRETHYDLPTARRGLVEVGPLREVRTDPFGLLQAERHLGEAATLWVYPRVHPLVPLTSGTRRDLDGPTSDGAAGSITFHTLREYVTGDDLRLVHWRSSARTGTLMVRQQVDPSQPHTTVVLDTHPDSYPQQPSGRDPAGAASPGSGGARDGDGAAEIDESDLFEAAVEAAASVLVASASRNFPARLLTGNGGLVGGRSGGKNAATTMLDHLTPLEPTGHRLGEVATRLAAEPGGNSLVVVTGNPDPPELMAIEALRNRYATMAVVRFQVDATPGAGWDGGMFDLVAPDVGNFATLWNARS